jgi:hypothetical protein
MKDELNQNIENPEELEKLYRTDKQGFNKSFRELFSEGLTTELQRFWDIRLRYEFPEVVKQAATAINEGLVIFILASILWLIIRFPMEMLEDHPTFIFKYYFNVIPYIFVGSMSLYILLAKGWLSTQNALKLAVITIVGIGYSYLLTEVNMDAYTDRFRYFERGLGGGVEDAQPLIMAFFHMIFLLWFSYSLAFSNYKLKDWRSRFDYITYNADLGIINAIVHIGILAVLGITMGLFMMIDAKSFVEFFTKNIVTFMYLASPFLATYIYRKYPVIGTKIVPALANIFSVLVLAILIVFLMAFPFSNKNPFEERGFLILFNVVQIVAMAIIFFGLTGSLRKSESSRFSQMVLFYLGVVTTIINAIAFASISYRLFHYGYSPFKLTATIGNLVFLINMVLIVKRMYHFVFNDEAPEELEKTIANYLTIYAIWSAIVVFLLPWIL